MTRVQLVHDPADPRVHDYVALTDVELRRRREPADGIFIAEGARVIRRAVRAGYPLRSVFTARRWLEPLADVLADAAEDVEVFTAEEDVLRQVTGYPVHRGALAAMARRPLPEADALLPDARRLAVLESVNDHTNIGGVFRGAAALGVDAVLLSPDCADPLYRRAVKVSMGAVFAIPYARLAPWPGGLERVRAAGFRLLALTPHRDAAPLAEAVGALAGGRAALLLGAEGPGLTGRVLAAADVPVRIPMAAGVDSLNVAAAAAVAFYALGVGDAGISAGRER